MFKFVLSLCLALIGNQAFSAEKQDTVPADFQGNWSSSLKKCGTADEMNLIILSAEIKYWESAGSIISVVINTENEIALISELSGEGATWLALDYYRLSADKTQLTDISNPLSETPALRYKCPSK